MLRTVFYLAPDGRLHRLDEGGSWVDRGPEGATWMLDKAVHKGGLPDWQGPFDALPGVPPPPRTETGAP